jgi:hypothetical protein
MPVTRPANHPEPERRAALVRELCGAASAAGHGRGRVGFTPDQNERFIFSRGRNIVLNVRLSLNHRKTDRTFRLKTPNH